ncbi:hypothetical protein SCHPADRAFT_934430 [Schizopora paradoxa]|uniref:Swi5-domain-containing protein n=1 Tax=Schizopora paradoxa TaxID=27342 RepID=A0A0H2SU01_9AGAM|nr:hypothetical protein SCHPADRAFT_934430 [Schizopora paradoxa]
MFARHVPSSKDDAKACQLKKLTVLISIPTYSAHWQDNEQRAEELKNEIAKLQAQLGDEDAGKIVSQHHELLHKYNETKDATQFLIGKLAMYKETTIKQLHADYNLPMGD